MTIVLMGTGGSSGRSLAVVGDALARRLPGQSVRFVDTQPFNLRTGGTTFYPGDGDVVIASPEDCGLRRYTSSWSLNMILNGGQSMYRRMIRYGERLIGADADVLVTCHDRIYIETALIRAARNLGAATVMLQEGPFCSIGHSAARSRTLRTKAALAPLVTRLSGILPEMPDYGMAGHDRVIAASESYRARWIAAGIGPGSISVGGIPRYDSLAFVQPVDRREAGAALRLLYLAQPFAAHGKVDAGVAIAQQRILAEGLNRAAALRPIEVTIRSHPRSGRDDAAALRGALAFDAIEDNGGEPLERVLPHVDLVVGHYSSGMLESLMAGRPVLCVPVPEAAFAERGEGEKQRWLTGIGIAAAATVAEIAASVVATDGMPATVDWSQVHDEVGAIDGHASEKCAELIARLIEARGATA